MRFHNVTQRLEQYRDDLHIRTTKILSLGDVPDVEPGVSLQVEAMKRKSTYLYATWL